MKQKRRCLGALCLLVLFIAYQTSITAFTHVHYVNGVIITHTHPFQGAHSHCKASYLAIGHLPTLCSSEVDACENLHPMRALLAVFKAAAATHTVKGEVVRAISLRAPPALALSLL